jgi:nonribosomal peptide synthetase DhbF
VAYAIGRSPAAFLRLLADQRVIVLNQTPSVLRQLLLADEDHPEVGAWLALRYIVFGGESLDSGSFARRCARHAEDVPRLFNMYGITETTVHISYLALDRTVAAQPASSLIGRPLANLGAYVLDAALWPMPAGDLYVKAAGFALGYLAWFALTARRFVADPFGAPGACMYRTGDLARRHGDDGLDFLGRTDE